jgi:transcriptional regulator with XRE-family HTH domain
MRIQPPNHWIEPWPNGRVRPDAPVAAMWTARLARALSEHLERSGTGINELAANTGLSASTVRGVLHGTRWPTLRTAVSLSAAIRG